VTDRSETDVSIPNLAEYHIDGPSKFLPQGQLLTLLEVPRFSHCVRGSMTDRRDFYHQASVSPERARSNMLPFHFPLERFEKTNAMTEFLTRTTAGLSCKREKIGDGFRHGLLPTSVRRKLPSSVFPAFRSLFQGDHLVVEFALRSHEVLLQGAGLLSEDTRLRGHKPFPVGRHVEAIGHG
jgi:hypothetical protein